MIVTATDIEGCYLLDIEPITDSRGLFARLWCKREFQHHGIDIDIVQTSISQNNKPGTLRGMHFQWPPSCEGKLVRCQQGRIFDAVIDLRPDSSTFAQCIAFELDSAKHNSLYIPAGCGHGFQTLEADTEVAYMMSDYYRPDLQDGLRYDDPAFAIAWPLPVSTISDRDLAYPAFDPDGHTRKYAQARLAEESIELPHTSTDST